MPHLSPVPWRIFERWIVSQGCRLIKTKSGHKAYARAGMIRPVIFSTSGRDVPVHVIKNNLRILGVETEEFLRDIGKA